MTSISIILMVPTLIASFTDERPDLHGGYAAWFRGYHLALDLAIRYGLFYIQEDQMVLGYQKINRTQITRACRCHLRPVNIKFGISLSWLTYAYPRGYNARFRHLPSPS